MKKHKIKLAQLSLVITLIMVALFVVHNAVNNVTAANNPAPPTVASPPDVSDILNETDATATNCRYGVSLLNDNDFNFLSDLGIGWILDFSVNFGNDKLDGAEYTPIIRFKPKLDTAGNRTGNYIVTTQPFNDNPGGLGPVIAAHPGKLWLVGNEVDRVEWQDDLMPDVYAKAYHDAYHFIKDRDPSAQVAISGLVQVTPGRLQYLDKVWDAYLAKYNTPMPVDVWNMHIYILAEKLQDGSDASAAIALGTDPALAIWESGNNAALCSNSNVYCYAEHDSISIFKQQVVAMRQWMKDHGQQNKPLILSEFSLLYAYNQEGDSDPNTCFLKDEYGNCFTPERVSKFMASAFNYLETAADPELGFSADNNRLVQQWLWYTTYWYGTFSSNLLEGEPTSTSYVLTLPGQTYMAQVNGKRPFSIQPEISQVSFPTANTSTPGGTTSANIAATIYNNGDTRTTTDVTVNFYSDSAKNNLIGTATIPAGLTGCATRSELAEVVWNDLSTGQHPYWAEVEGGNTVAGFVIINPEQVLLPFITR